jgi:hypothetical protein
MHSSFIERSIRDRHSIVINSMQELFRLVLLSRILWSRLVCVGRRGSLLDTLPDVEGALLSGPILRVSSEGCCAAITSYPTFDHPHIKACSPE